MLVYLLEVVPEVPGEEMMTPTLWQDPLKCKLRARQASLATAVL